MRARVKQLEGGGALSLEGVGAMEVSEGRSFIVGVMDNLRRLGASREAVRRENQEEDGNDDDDDDDDMEL